MIAMPGYQPDMAENMHAAEQEAITDRYFKNPGINFNQGLIPKLGR